MRFGAFPNGAIIQFGNIELDMKGRPSQTSELNTEGGRISKEHKTEINAEKTISITPVD